MMLRHLVALDCLGVHCFVTKCGRLADVFEKEPFVHPKLLTCPNAFLLPHLASATESTRYDMTQRMLDNARRVLWDKSAPLNPLNAPTEPMSALSADEQARVRDYIAAEFAYEEAEVLVEESARL
jgi:hypothetical protein